jgi:hypothetical protein
MKIRMLTGISGPEVNVSPKEETEAFNDHEAIRLMVSNQAEPADDESAEALRLALGAPPVPPADERPADEPPADEPPADERPADEPPADEPPADEPPADEPPADELDAITNALKLKSIAKAEGFDLGEARSAAEIRVVIRARRQAKAG